MDVSTCHESRQRFTRMLRNRQSDSPGACQTRYAPQCGAREGVPGFLGSYRAPLKGRPGLTKRGIAWQRANVISQARLTMERASYLASHHILHQNLRDSSARQPYCFHFNVTTNSQQAVLARPNARASRGRGLLGLILPARCDACGKPKKHPKEHFKSHQK